MSILEQAEEKRTATGYQWRWEERAEWRGRGMRISLSRIADRRTGIEGRLSIYWEKDGVPSIINSADPLRLLGPRSKMDFVQTLLKVDEVVPWADLINAVCLRAVQIWETPTTAERLDGEPVDLSTDYLVRPLIVRNEVNLFFGDGDSYKSFAAQLLSFLLGYGQPYLGFIFGGSCNVLYLDYETTKRVMDQRIAALQEGLGFHTAGNIVYRRCEVPLVEDLENIQQIMLDNDISFLVTDSYGMACGGDINSQEVARATIGALRYLGGTALGISHVSTDTVLGKQTMATPYGNRFWNNLTRWSWLVRSLQEDEHSLVGFFHSKHNVGPRWSRLVGLVIDWQNNVPTIRRDDEAILNTPELMQGGLPAKDLLATALRRGSRMMEELVADTGLKAGHIRNLVTRNPKTFTKVSGGAYALLYYGNEEP